jgi:hypothetical protein
MLHALDTVAERMTTDVRDLAVDRGWDTDVAASLTVENNGGRLEVSYHGADISDFQNLEYGTQDSPPRSVVNTVLHSNGFKKETNHYFDPVRQVAAQYVSEMLR